MTCKFLRDLIFLPLALGPSVSHTYKVISHSRDFTQSFLLLEYFFYDYYMAGCFSTFKFQLKYDIPRKSFLAMLVRVVGLLCTEVVRILR